MNESSRTDLPRFTSLDGDGEVTFAASLSIGRHPANDLVVEHPRVSSRHASVEWEGDRWRIKDLGSSNGTSVNGKRITGRRALKAGDVVRFARVSRWEVTHLCTPDEGEQLGATEKGSRRLGDVDPEVELHLAEVSPGEGTIRVVGREDEWSVTTGNRFVLLLLLARAGNHWVDDDDLRIGLWGRPGVRDMDPSALHKLIHDTRKMFLQQGVNGWFIEKAGGRTRLRLAPERIHLSPT